ncbi:hypothetical protein CCACVL1_19096 [Corchorus capsularis]|uniref:Uncharacterized protein n=1 Tax=Corchorus capsularis TaxID=210143 RepID=A0A1R3HII8_COCAP|nr:hypothetical protein CCACVL1_19096 [Corchorus capsularis]
MSRRERDETKARKARRFRPP